MAKEIRGKEARREENEAILAHAMRLAEEQKSVSGDYLRCVREAAERLGVEELDQKRAQMLSEVVNVRLRRH